MSRIYYISFVIIRFIFDIFSMFRLAKKIKIQFHFDNGGVHFFQQKKINKIIKSALKTEYYKNYFKNIGLNEKKIKLDDFPIITKNDIQNSPANFNIKNILIPKTIGNTGGSTGKPLSFHTDLNCRLTEFGHQLFFYKELGYKINDMIYSFGGVKISKNNISKNIFWKKKVVGFPFGKIIFSAEMLSDNNVSFYLNKILLDKPQFLRGYPSAIIILCNYIKKNKVKIDFIKGVLLTSEVVIQSNIHLISQSLNCKVIPQYGHTENAVFAFTLPNKLKYFCSPFYGVTEVINPDTGLHVEKGMVGEIIVTSLSNRYQPFIRYNTGDLAIYGGSYNNFVILDKIFGREQDFIFDSNSKKILLVGLIFGSHSKVFNYINDWQFCQNKIGELLINISPNISWNVDLHEKLIYDLFRNVNLEIKIFYNMEFIKTSQGKRKFLINNI